MSTESIFHCLIDPNKKILVMNLWFSKKNK